jgi:hypothetical protein
MVASRQLRVFFRINFDYDGATPHLSRSPGDLRRSHSAGSAPRRPEIYQHGDASILDNFIELFSIDIERFVHWRQRRLTYPATAGIRKMSRGHAVLGCAIFTDTNHWHSIHALRV